MGIALLRTTNPDDFLKSAISRSSSSDVKFADKLFGFDEVRNSKKTHALLEEAASANEDEVRGLANAIAPSLADSVGLAWRRLQSFSIALPGWTVGEPAADVNRAIWLRDLLRELARFELPSKREDALLWLAIYCGSNAKKVDSEFAALMAALLGGALYKLGTTGCDHVGRLLGCELAKKDRNAENLLDTLRLVGTGRHPALSPDDRHLPSPHVARALALCGREDAFEILCETITVDRGNTELAVTSAVQATAAAVEAFSVFPSVLPLVLETIAGELVKGKLDHESLAKQLASIIALPAAILAQSTCDSFLRECAIALRDAERRQQMIASNEAEEVFIGFWAEAVIDAHACVSQLLTRYEQACVEGHEDTKLLLRTIARIREGQSLVMRPMWLWILKESIGEAASHLNVSLIAEAMQFGAASGLTLEDTELIPADDALDLLVEIEKRLRDERWMTELVKASPDKSPDEIRNTLVRLIVLNLAGRPGDAMLPFVDRMDSNSIAVLVNADLSKTDAVTRKAIFNNSRAHTPHGPKLMVRAVAAAESTQELLDWILEQRRLQHPVNAIFSLACALRIDRLDLWRQLLLASKKDRRYLGIEFLLSTLKVIDDTHGFNESKILAEIPTDIVVDCNAIRNDVSLVFDEYEAVQSKKKSGDDLKSRTFLIARDMSRSLDEVHNQAHKRRIALARLCERVADMTGFDRSRFVPTPPQRPRDRGSFFADIVGEIAPKLLERAAQLLNELTAQSLPGDERKARLHEWFDNRGHDLREPSGLERLRLNHCFLGPGNWQYFDEKVLNVASPLMTAEQSQRIIELRPPALPFTNDRAFTDLVRSLKWEANGSYDSEHAAENRIIDIDWYESVLANLPEAIQKIGPLGEYAAFPHPPHEQAIASVFMDVKYWLDGHKIESTLKKKVRERLWPLLWWTASFGGRVEGINATAIGTAVSCGQASLADLVWYLTQPGHNQMADNLVHALEYPDRICLGFNSERDEEIRAVVNAVADICRQQEQAVDPALPSILAESWRKMPAPKDQNGLSSVIFKYADVAYQTVGRTDDKQKAFAARLREAIDEAEESWIVSEDYFAPKYVKFEILDAWLKRTTSELRKLIEELAVSEDVLLRIAFDRPLLMRCVLDAIGRSEQLEAAIWIAFHAGLSFEELAITLNADTGHTSIRRSELSTKQIEQRLLDQYRVAIKHRPESLFCATIEDATIRRSWKEAAIDVHPREKLEPMLKTLKAITSPTNRLRVEGLLDAMDGKLNPSPKRKALEASIQDRPNLALLQLAVMPLPVAHDALVADISQRLKIFEAMSVAGRKRKTAEAQDGMRRALDQVRRTLADNAGLVDPIQLDWLSGEAIAKELAQFERCEAGEYIIQLRLRGDGPHVMVTKSGKSLKSVPAAFKSSDLGKRLSDLQSRIKISLRDTRAVLEASMIEQRIFSPDDLQMMMKHPVVAAVAGELVFGMNPTDSKSPLTFGLPVRDGKCLIGPDGVESNVSQPVFIAHPLDLDEAGVLARWRMYFTDQPPQAFQQVDRGTVRAAELETADEGKRIVRHDGVTIANEEQAFRILQAHGWRDDGESHKFCRTFHCESHGEITAILDEFMWSNRIGSLGFRLPDWSELAISEVPPIILSEAIRDIDRTVSSTQG